MRQSVFSRAGGFGLPALLPTGFGLALCGAIAWSIANLFSQGIGATAPAQTMSRLAPPATPSRAEIEARRQALIDKTAREIAAKRKTAEALAIAKADRAAPRGMAGKASRIASADPFDAVARKAALDPKSLQALFTGPAAAKAARLASAAGIRPTRAASPRATIALAAAAPISDETTGSVALAYADASPRAAARAFSALTSVDTAPVEPDALPDDEGALSGPVFEELPGSMPLPSGRPATARAEEPADAARKPERQQRVAAIARPNDPASAPNDGTGNPLRNFFGGGGSVPKGGRGVAVYDISAAKVHMPDGTVLEAHSGIGHMADNPRYTHVKMKGPTPIHTYNLRMRESLFHGVEAIRMLPVDGRNKHGRDGFLAHSYLLRGGRAESHGCVAFKHYDKFLKAFKQGKVKQMVVVGSGGRQVFLAKNGNSVQASAGTNLQQ